MVWSGLAVSPCVAQQGATVRSARAAQYVEAPLRDSSVALAFVLPVPRRLGDVPPVSALGALVTLNGTSRTLPVTPKLAVGDLGYYEIELSSLHPLSLPTIPTDSLRVARVARAMAWLVRLRTARYDDPDGTQALALADVALQAQQDTLARHIVDAQLKRTTDVAQKANLLRAAIEIFANGIEDETHPETRVEAATTYFVQLQGFPVSGYPLLRDSAYVAVFKAIGAMQMVDASIHLKRLDAVYRYTDQALAALARVDADARGWYVRNHFPFREMASLIRAQPNGQTMLDTMTRVRSLVSILPDYAVDLQRIALLGTSAPPLAAHAWLNTADSSYAATPRLHAYEPGVIHLVAFGLGSRNVLLERLHRRFPTVHIILMHETRGAVGVNVVEPQTEIAWYDTYVRTILHATFPVGIWAGPKERNMYGGMTPQPSLVRQGYLGEPGLCTLVDGAGKIREFLPAKTRADEAHIAAALSAVLNEATTSPHVQ